MDTDRPLRVALVGIDGSGKTSVARRMRERAGGDPRLAVLHTIRPHETPDGPLHALSRHLQTLSVVADELRSPQLKVAAFYLQLCSYAPVERFFLTTYRPQVVLADRHPLVDTLVYLPLYGRATARLGPTRRPDGLRERISAIDPAAYEAVLCWARHIGCDEDLWALGGQLLALHTLTFDEMTAEFRRRFRAVPPDLVVLLDLEVEQALGRLRGRGRAAELHETAAQLRAVRRHYDTALAWLGDGHEPVRVCRLGSGGRSVDEIVDGVTALLPAPVGSQPRPAARATHRDRP